MKKCLFLGDSITDADHLFDPSGLGYGYVRMLSSSPELSHCILKNRGHAGFTIEQVHRMLQRDGIEDDWDIITLLAGVNDIPVEVYTSHPRIPQEFQTYYQRILDFLTTHTTAKLVLIEPFLFDSPAEYKNWFPLLDLESSIIQKLALTYHACFLPTLSLLRSHVATDGIEQITSDGIHLTPRGNQLLADLWISSCKKDEIL